MSLDGEAPGELLVCGEGAITSHLFVLAPNNSGSTFLAGALARSPGAWHLEREGQHVEGFVGPSSRGTGARLLWASRPEWIATFRDPAARDWPRTRRAWHFKARAFQAGATALVVTSPPFLLFAEELAVAFPEARFIVLVRNPYAVAEGIMRRPSAAPVAAGDAIEAAAARHIVAALAAQAENCRTLGDRALFLRYEDMCHDPAVAARAIQALAPALGPVALDRSLPVKGEYHEPLRDMNDQQIARLGPERLAALNAVFDGHRGLLEGFGYARIGA